MRRTLTRKVRKLELHAIAGGIEGDKMLEQLNELAKLGMSSADLEQIVEAMIHGRTLAFGWGDIRDVGGTCTEQLRCRECRRAMADGELAPHVYVNVKIDRHAH